MPPSPGADVLTGTNNADLIHGLAGNDFIYGHGAVEQSPLAGRIEAVRIATGFEAPVGAVAAPGDPGYLYILEKDSGEIHRLDVATGVSTLFMDIPNAEFAGSGERGVLGLAFHPNYAANGRFFLNLTNADGDIEIREYQRVDGPTPTGDATDFDVLLTIEHSEFGNHNGGSIVFSPDGSSNLYISVGDGGSGNDPDGNGQNTDALLGKILRIDVDSDDFPDPGRNYGIPDDNPFADGADGAPEVWVYGLRNPWRITFDSATGDLYIADVGQSAREEIDFQPAGSDGGENYGWDIMEGSLGGPVPGAVLPIFEYGRDLGTVVTGGFVYRGPGTEFPGSYFLVDFASARLWTLNGAGGVATGVTERTDQVFNADEPMSIISSFGVDSAGRLYAVRLSGSIFRLDFAPLAGDVGDSLFGDDGDDKLFGGAGDDILNGGADDDVLIGGFGADSLLGGSGNDFLDGGSGLNILRGGSGNDTYVVDKLGDQIVEAAGGGRDLVRTTLTLALQDLLEDLRLVGADDLDGTGNSAANAVWGNSGDNDLFGLDGNDRLMGANGSDILDGGDGNDVLAGNEDGDTLLGGAGADVLRGGAGTDHLDGGTGGDNMGGGLGSDIYAVDSSGDRVIEESAAGRDLVRSSVSFIIRSSVETLVLTGSANINGVGNGIANHLVGNAGRNNLLGNAGNDRLVGGAGNDVLVGGQGNDILTGSGGDDSFVFRTALDRNRNVDRILDFAPADDVIRIDNAAFAGLSTGALSPAAFRIGPAAADSSDRIIYNRSNGALFFDANGNAAGGVTRFATLDPSLDLTSGHFFVI